MVGACTLVLAGLVAAGARTGTLPIRAYTTADGLAHDAVNRIVQDSRGFVWFCTEGGLSRFDGDRFASFTASDGLPSDRVTDLVESRDGNLWIATDRGLARLGRTIEAVPLKLDESALDLRCLHEDRSGVLWAGATAGLFRIDRAPSGVTATAIDLVEPTASLPPIQVNAIASDAGGALWIATRHGGLYRRDAGGRIERLRVLTERETNVRAIAQADGGSLWLATRDGVVHIAGGARAPTIRPADLPSLWVSDVLRASDGTLYLATANGLGVVHDGDGEARVRRIGLEEGLSQRAVTGLMEDRNGNIWMATPQGGAMKLASAGFETYPLPRRSAASDPRAFLETRRGDFVVVQFTEGQGMFLERFTGTGFESFLVPLPPIYLGWGSGQLVVQGRDGTWWIPTGAGGLYRFPPSDDLALLARAKPVAVYRAADGLGADEIFRLFEDAGGDLWISAGGLVRRDGATGRFERSSEIPGAPHEWIHAFADDPSGGVWMGNDEGVFLYRDGRFTRYGTDAGLPGGLVRALAVDGSGELWIAVDRGGLAKLSGGRFERFTEASGLSSDAVQSLAVDRAGLVYVGTDRGVDAVDPATGRVTHYSRAEGLEPGELHIARVDRSGDIWFGGHQGVSRLRPKPHRAAPPPQAFISGLRFAGVPYALSPLGVSRVDGVRLPPDARQVEVEFVSPHATGPGSIRYQYRLGGGAPEWSAPSETRSIHYASLSAGRYEFQVRAVDGDGQMSVSPAAVAFTIPPPLWARWWSLGLMGLSLSGGAYAAYRYRVGRLLELERVRSRIAADLHDDVGASLSQIAILSEVAMAGRESAAGPLRRIAGAAREAVENMGDIVWAIDPQRDRAANLVSRMRAFAGELLEGRAIDLRFAGPAAGLEAAVGPDLRRQVLLIFKESLHNAVRHSECTRVDVDVRIDGSRFRLEVKDDGSGIPDGAHADGLGLASMKRRAAGLGGTCSIEAGPSGGTIVTLDVPLR